LWFLSTSLDGMAERYGKIVATLRTLADCISSGLMATKLAW
jgi:hypothetical protein